MKKKFSFKREEDFFKTFFIFYRSVFKRIKGETLNAMHLFCAILHAFWFGWVLVLLKNCEKESRLNHPNQIGIESFVRFIC